MRRCVTESFQQRRESLVACYELIAVYTSAFQYRSGEKKPDFAFSDFLKYI